MDVSIPQAGMVLGGVAPLGEIERRVGGRDFVSKRSQLGKIDAYRGESPIVIILNQFKIIARFDTQGS